jgi:hypothetical protein
MWRRVRDEEDGVALVTVLMITSALLVLVVSTMSYAIGSLPISRHDQDWNSALAAAESGVDDYLYRLDADGNYWTYSAANPPSDGNLAFQQYVKVPGVKGGAEFFRYGVDTSTIQTDGTVKLTVTGKMGNTARTIYTTLRRRSFLDYLYFTDYETKDPATYTGVPFTAAQAQTSCALHYYENRDSRCVSIYFVSADVIKGPLHSNDAINISGDPQFNDDVTTSWNDPSGRGWLGAGSPSFANAGDPSYVDPLTLPPSNSAIRAEADGDQGGSGCLYTGPTKIIMNSTGTLNVVSPFTKRTNPGCGPGNGLTLPTNGVIFVQNVPATTTDPNYTSGCPYAGSYPPGLPVPLSGDLTTYGCRDGDIFISGTLNGKLTVAADHNIVIVDNVQYAPPGFAGSQSVLGLIANNYVQVFHPVNCASGTSSSCNLNIPGRSTPFNNPIVQAAILSVQHSFGEQNYTVGAPLGTLNVTGAIAQRYRGPVGTFSGSFIATGYAKNYVYDTRLKYLSPPKFLDPVKSGWQVATWAEVVNPTTFP